MQDVIRLTEQYLDKRNPDAIDRQGQLFSCIALVLVFHIVLSIAFIKLQEIEKKHHHFHPGPSITYDLMIAPPVVHKKIDPPVEPPQIALQQGKVDIGGKASAAKHSEKLEIPKPQPIMVPPPELNKVGDPIASAKVEPTRPTPIDDHGSLISDGEGIAGKEKTGDIGEGIGRGGTIGSGTALAFAGGDPVPAPPPAPEKRDIAPYRNSLLIALAEVWRPKRDDKLVVLLTLAPDGSILKAEVEESSDESAVKRFAKALERVQFEALPDWYHGKSLPVRLHLEGTNQ